MTAAGQAFSLIVLGLLVALALGVVFVLVQRARKPPEKREPIKSIFTNRGAQSAAMVLILLTLLVLIS